MGFSAGGHLASSVCTHADDAVRPDFAILFYPVISMDETVTHKGSCVGFLGEQRNDPELQAEWSNQNKVVAGVTPPTIILLASDDRAVPAATNGVAYYAALCKAGIRCEFHGYPSGGHGFGFKSTFKYHDRMLDNLSNWLRQFEN
jgi:acetyl esterase/lipase